jgi:outer membrane lipoprotein-sorting protein
MNQFIMGGAIFGLLLMSPFSNMTPEEKGRAILLKNEENFDNYVDSAVDVFTQINLGDGKSITRHMKLDFLHVPDDGDKILMYFESPADVKGLSMLLESHKFEYDDAWIYIPDRRRVKRISSQNKGGQFMGTAFVFEDLMRLEPEKFDYKFIRDIQCGELKCYEFERYPKEKSSVYSKQVAWVDKDKFRLHRVQYHNLEGKHVKTAMFNDYKLYSGKYWRWSELVMLDHLTNNRTVNTYKNWKFGVGLRKNLFTVNGLKNLR